MAQSNEIMRLICPTHGSQRVPASNYACPHGDYTPDAPSSPEPTFLYQDTSLIPSLPDAVQRINTLETSVDDLDGRVTAIEEA